ncbi:MAG: hypothetical protein RSE59_06865, partial [Clostridia bacterium]
MFKWQMCPPVPVDRDPSGLFSGMAFDGGSFYFLFEGCDEILVCDRQLSPEKRIRGQREYIDLCYDASEGCFWAIARAQAGGVFKLNAQLEEIGYLRVTPCALRFPHLTGIACPPDGGGLLVAVSCCVAEIAKQECCAPMRLWQPEGENGYEKVACVGGNRVCVARPGSETPMWLLTDEAECALEGCVPPECTVVDVSACAGEMYLLLTCCGRNLVAKASVVWTECPKR